MCFNCPNNSVIIDTQTGASTIRDCVCAVKYFNPLGQSVADPNRSMRAHWEDLFEGAVGTSRVLGFLDGPSPFASHTLCAISPVSACCYPQGRPCFPCPVGATCEGGLTMPYPKYGFWQLRNHRFKPVFVSCKPQELCLNGGYCADGYRGNLCSDCRVGYYRRGIRCRKCSSGYQLSLGWSLAFVLTTLGLMCFGMYFLASAEALKRSATAYVLLYFCQSLDSFDMLTMRWPKEWQLFFSVMSVFNFDLQQAQIDCFQGWGGIRNTIMFQLSLPLFALSIYVVLLFLYMMLLWISRIRRLTPPVEALLRLQRSPRLSRAVDRSVGAYVAILSLMYPMLVKTTFSLFACREVDDLLELQYLDIMPSIECYGEEHNKLILIAVIAVVIYVLGIPAFFFYLLFLGAKRSSLDHPVFRQRFGSLYLRYERRFWWWEVVVMGRRFAVIFMIVFASRYELLQTAGTMIIYFFSVIAQDNARPYDRELVDNFEFLQLLACHFILLLGVIYDGARKDLAVDNSDCTSSNCTVVSEYCTHEENKRNTFESWQSLSTMGISVMLVASFALGVVTIWVQVHTVVKKRFAQKDKSLEDPANSKLSYLLELSTRVLNPDVVPATKDWLLTSTPSEREYFKHLMQLLDQNYEDWLALEHKNMRDFLERAQEQLIDNTKFILKFVSTIGQIICCLRVRKKKVNQFGAKQIAQPSKVCGTPRSSPRMHPYPPPQPRLHPIATSHPLQHHPPPRMHTRPHTNPRLYPQPDPKPYPGTHLLLHLCFPAPPTPFTQAKRDRFGRKMKTAKGNDRAAEAQSGMTSNNLEEDDLVEAYLRSRVK